MWKLWVWCLQKSLMLKKKLQESQKKCNENDKKKVELMKSKKKFVSKWVYFTYDCRRLIFQSSWKMSWTWSIMTSQLHHQSSHVRWVCPKVRLVDNGFASLKYINQYLITPMVPILYLPLWYHYRVRSQQLPTFMFLYRDRGCCERFISSSIFLLPTPSWSIFMQLCSFQCCVHFDETIHYIITVLDINFWYDCLR